MKPQSVFPAENETSPLDALIRSETRAKLMTLIRTLDHRNRQVILLRYYSNFKIRQIAARMNLPISNVQARLYRACESLRRLLYFHPELRSLRVELRDQFPPLEQS
jgi:RNA polymerase sigma factor (sigma-70 family)